jgi:hypothetical protein
LPKLRREHCFWPVFELRRLSAEAARVDSSGARDHNARCAWLGASGRRRSSSRRYPRQLFCIRLVGFPVRARAGTAARMNPLQLESGRLGAWIGARPRDGSSSQIERAARSRPVDLRFYAAPWLRIRVRLFNRIRRRARMSASPTCGRSSPRLRSSPAQVNHCLLLGRAACFSVGTTTKIGNERFRFGGNCEPQLMWPLVIGHLGNSWPQPRSPHKSSTGSRSAP